MAPSSQLDAQNLLYARHPYLYKSPLLSPQSGDQQDRSGAASTGAAASSNAVSMWPPLVMPLHLGKHIQPFHSPPSLFKTPFYRH